MTEWIDLLVTTPVSHKPHADFKDVLLMVLRLGTILCFQKFFK